MKDLSRVLQINKNYRFSALNRSKFLSYSTIPPDGAYALRDRMLASAMNFALGFFGWPLDNQYYQSITIEAEGVGRLCRLLS